jgi:hypothetical protein
MPPGMDSRAAGWDTFNPSVLHAKPLSHSQVGGSSTLTCYKDSRYTCHPSGPCDLGSVRLNQRPMEACRDSIQVTKAICDVIHTTSK